MLSVETAKKLKDAGFPQKEAEFNCQYCPDAFGKPKQPEVYIPSLSELIYACGENVFKELTNISIFTDIDTLIEWLAESFGGEIGKGQSSEEAVANLYLETHKK